MARPKSSKPEIQRFDEANVAYLGLFSIQERIPKDFVSWNYEFEIDGQPASLSCDALARHGGVPHGLDNDVSLALLALYQDVGNPADGSFVTTPHAILSIIGLDTSGHYYKALKESLERLFSTTYTASKSWRKGEGWTSVKFRYLDKLEYTTNREREFSGSTVIRVTLASAIVESFLARQVKPLDFGFLTTLQRPLTRALYRLLDAQRHAGGQTLESFEVGLVAWARACKILDEKPARIRRTLDRAHADLIDRGYLQEAVYLGSRSDQSIRYVFAQNPDAEKRQHMEEVLTALGVSRVMAQLILAEHGVSTIETRLARHQAILDKGYKPRSRAGFLVDVLRDETGKYQDPEGFINSKKASTKRAPKAELATQESNLDPDKEWEGLSQEAQAAKASSVISVVMKKYLSTTEFGQLHTLMATGILSPREVAAKVVSAGFKGKSAVEELVQELRRRTEP